MAAESPVFTRQSARCFPSLLLLEAPRWPFDWHMFISLLQIWKLRPREGESFESDHTRGERKSQNWNLHSLSPGSLLFLSALPGCLRDSARFTLRARKGTPQLPAWIWGDWDLRVGLPLLHILEQKPWTPSSSQICQTDAEKDMVETKHSTLCRGRAGATPHARVNQGLLGSGPHWSQTCPGPLYFLQAVVTKGSK